MTQPNLSNTLHSLPFAKRLLALFVALSFFAALDAQAQSRIWSGGSGVVFGNGNWTTGANWAGGTAVDGGDSILFAGSTRLNNVNNLAVNGTANVNNWIAFSNNAGAFVLTGTNNTANALILTNAGVLTNFSTSTQTINFGMTFTNATGTANINTATGNIILNGIIFASNITKSGAATLFLNGTNTFTGNLTNDAGSIRVGNSSGLGTTAGGTAIVSGGALELTTNNAGGNISIGAESLSLAGTGINSAGALRNITGSNTYGGLITITNATRINSDAGTLALTNTGTITGPTFGLTFGGAGNINLASIIGTTTGTVTKDGAGTLTLSAANTYSGGTTINAGTVAISNASAFGSNTVTFGSNGTTVAALANLQVTNNYNLAGNGTIDVGAFVLTNTGIISNTGSLTKRGAGTLTLSAANTYSGGTTINAGTVAISNASSFGSNTVTFGSNGTTVAALANLQVTNNYNLAGNGTMDVGAFVLTNTGIISNTGSLTKQGAGTLILAAANTYTGDTIVGTGVARLSGSGRIADASSVVVSNGATFDFNSISDTVDGISGAGTVTLGSATLTVSNSATNNFSGALSGSGGLVKVGAGTQILSGTANSYGGTTTIGAGVLNVSTLANAGQNSSIGTNGTIIITNGGVLQYGGSAVSIDRNINLASGIGVIGVTNAATDLTISGVISNTGSLVKTNGGTLILSGANTYSGTTTVGAGVLNIQNNAGLGATNSGTTVVSGAALELEGGVIIGAEALTLNGTGISSGGALRNISGNNTYGGTITNAAASRINSDAGTLTLSGAINANSQALTFGGAGNIAANGAITNSTSTVTKDGAGTLTLAAANTYSGGTTINAGTVAISNASSFGSNTVTFGSNGTTVAALANLQVTNNYNLAGNGTMDVGAFVLTNTGIISNTGSLTKQGAGTLILAAANTYTGDTIVGTGVARLSGSGRIADASSVVVSNGATFDFNSISDTVDGISGAGTVTLGSATLTVSNSATNNFSGDLSGSGGLVKVGAGTQILSGTANSYGGTTTIGSGVLAVSTLANAGQNSSIGTNGTIIITNGGVLQYGGSTVSIDRNINLASGTGVIGVTNAGTDLTISGVISNTGSLVKTNGGTLILSGANTYSGTTTVGAGVLNIQNNAGLGATNSGTTVVSGAALELQGNISIGAEALTLNGTGINSGGALRNVAGTNTYGGAITLGSASTISADADSTLQLTNTIGGNFGKTFGGDGAISASRVISGSGGLTKIGTGTLTLGATNTFSGGISLFGGTLSVASSNNLGANTVTITNKATFSITDNSTTLTNSFVLTNGGATVFVAGGNTFWSGPITGGGGLVKQGGDLILNGAGKTNNIGAIGVQGGRLFVFDSLSNIAGSAITVSNGATLAFLISANTNIVTNSLTIASGGGLANRAGTLVVSNAANFATAGSIIFNNDDIPTTNIVISNSYPSLTGNLTVQVGGGNTNVGAVTFSGVVSGANTNTISKTGSGTLIFAGANTYSGGTVVAEGTLTLSGSGRLGATNGNVSIGAGTVNLGGLSRTNGAFTLDSGNLTNGTLTATSYALTNAGAVSAVLAGSGALTKSGAGTATLSGANTYTGGTTVNAGTLTLSGSGTFGATNGALTIGAGTVDLGGLSRTNGAFTLDSGNLTNGTLTATSYALTNAGAVSAVLAGSGALTKSGAGTVVLSSATNSYTGTTTVGGGVLRVTNLVNANNNSSIGAGTTVILTNGGVLDYAGTTNSSMNRGINLAAGNGGIGVSNSAVALTISGAISNTGTLVKSGAGTLILTASNTYSGGTLLNAGTLAAGNAFAFGAGSVTIGSGTTLNLSNLSVTNVLINNGGTLTNLGTVSGAELNAGSTTIASSNSTVAEVSGTAQVTVSGVNTTITNVTGGTVSIAGTNTTLQTVDAGTLNIAGTNTTVQTLNGGTVNVTNGRTLVVQSGSSAGAISGGGGLVKSGTSALILSGDNTFTGGAFLNEGTLRLASATAAGGSSITQSNGSSRLVVDTTGTVTNQMSVFYLQSLQTVTLSGAKTLNNATYDITNNTTTTESGTLSGSGGITKLGTGTLAITASNTFTGAVDVQAGVLNLNSLTGSAAGGTTNVAVASGATLLVSQNNQVNNAATVSLTGGTIRTASGVSEAFGNLTVTGSGFLDFGTTSYANANTINFGTYTPSALLTINNFDYGSTLTFGSDLTSTINNSSFFTFNNGGIASSSWNGTTFTITAIPEPSTYLAAAGLLALMLWPSRKRLLKDAQKILGLRAPTRDRLAAQRLR